MLTKKDLGLVQILPMLDEETSQEPRVTSASISDQYLLLIREDNSIYLAQMDKNHELEEMDKSDSVKSGKWVAGCLYNDTKGVFQASPTDAATKEITPQVMMFLLTVSGALHVRSLWYHLCVLLTFSRYMLYLIWPTRFSLQMDYRTSPLFSPQTTQFAEERLARVFTELLVADLGDAVSQIPYLIVSSQPPFRCAWTFADDHSYATLQMT